MKECTDEELLEIFEVPKIADAIITPANYSRGYCLFAPLIPSNSHSYIWKDVLHTHWNGGGCNRVAFTPATNQQTLHGSHGRSDHLVLSNAPKRSSPLPPSLISRTISTTPFPRFLPTILPISFWTFYSFVPECPSSPKLPPRNGKTSLTGPLCWLCRCFAACVKTTLTSSIPQCSFPVFPFRSRYASDIQSHSILLYPFQLFGLLLPSSTLPNIRSPSATRCQLLLNLLLCVNSTTKNPFELALNRMASRFGGE